MYIPNPSFWDVKFVVHCGSGFVTGKSSVLSVFFWPVTARRNMMREKKSSFFLGVYYTGLLQESHCSGTGESTTSDHCCGNSVE